MPTYMSSKAAAKYLGYAESTLRKMRMRGDGPPYHQKKKGGKVTYIDEELDAWVAKDTRSSTSEDYENDDQR